MLKQYAPMLAKAVDLKKLKYPVLLSSKLDGFRCVVVKGKPLSRKLKLIPNKHIQEMFRMLDEFHEGLDGELIVGKPYGEGVFQRTSSGVTSRDGEPKFTYYVFDRMINPDRGYHDRFLGWAFTVPWIKVVPQVLATNEHQLRKFYKGALKFGYEGIVIRDPYGIYKHGRSTVKQGILLKLTPVETAEATIVGFKEEMHNGNTLTADNLGHAKRSTKKAGKTPRGVLGAFRVESENYRELFDVGTGFTRAQRALYWASRNTLRGKIIRFKHKTIGAVDAPRHPVFQGFRSKIDL